MSLRPIPFGALVQRLVRELATCGDDGSVLELPARRIFHGAGVDLSVRHHGRRAANPFGPAAGPHTQLAQNIAVAWLAGARIVELKTVQVRDDLVIPRPCIDMATVGYNVEWSQELRLEESAREYAKASMLVTMLRHGGLLDYEPGSDETLFDLSVGYDLAGIRSPAVVRFLDQMADAGALVRALRAEIPPEHAQLAALDFDKTLSRSVTLSTFHGCPPSEIEAIAAWLMRERGLDVTVKLNPTLLGRQRVREVLHEVLGYRDIVVPDRAFDHDPTWEQVTGIVERLTALASELGRSFGVKLTNTLVVENHRRFFAPSEREMYLSGPPLHVLASELVARFRESFGAALPISFSAGIDRKNLADAVASGLAPVTVCSDLLQPGGYGRAHGYLTELATRMQAVGARDVPSFIRLAYAPDGSGDAVANARTHLGQALADPRYAQAKNARPPRKLERVLTTFDCTSCDKCIPVCPNTAVFALDVQRPAVAERRADPHQIAIFADACNDCGNCDVFCPEHGGPNLTKPRFHGSHESYLAEAPRSGIWVERRPDGGFEAWGRLGGVEHHVASGDVATPEDGARADFVALVEGALAVRGSWLP
ncbi:MAG: 4Fe-4S dicluster domain-containing protein [Myxococcota bacterium]